jgi:hypothetical protein
MYPKSPKVVEIFSRIAGFGLPFSEDKLGTEKGESSIKFSISISSNLKQVKLPKTANIQLRKWKKWDEKTKARIQSRIT